MGRWEVARPAKWLIRDRGGRLAPERAHPAADDSLPLRTITGRSGVRGNAPATSSVSRLSIGTLGSHLEWVQLWFAHHAQPCASAIRN